VAHEVLQLDALQVAWQACRSVGAGGRFLILTCTPSRCTRCCCRMLRVVGYISPTRSLRFRRPRLSLLLLLLLLLVCPWGRHVRVRR
jgi:hypothetical protein